MRQRQQSETREMERSLKTNVWSKPGLPSDLRERIHAARNGSANLLAALNRMAAQ